MKSVPEEKPEQLTNRLQKNMEYQSSESGRYWKYGKSKQGSSWDFMHIGGG